MRATGRGIIVFIKKTVVNPRRVGTMLPVYGYIAIAALITAIIFIIVLFMRYKNNNKKPNMLAIISISLVLVSSTYLFLQAKDNKNRDEITNMIHSKGGKVISIESTDKGSTPFVNFDSHKARRKDDYYIVKYSLNSEMKTAWFKGDNALYRNPPTPISNKWIFE
ncbi:hypothetical protein J2T17_000036 [Paenibacillus mucilaginosus]|uniref:hypothetical protein n=1 Tax=Paenibacillus mucilaginosus TaxID=61624 RepID=UPI003D1CC349